MSEKNILITGGAGFIGSHLVDALINENKIICVDNFDPFYPKEIKKNNISKHLEHKNYKLYETDITDFNRLGEIFANEKISHVIHLAARAGVRPSIEMPMDYTKININGTINLLEHCKNHGIKNFVFGSSSSVYGIREEGPFSEDMRIDKPISPYAATKAAGEQLCYTYSHLYDMRIMCLRFFTVYGPRQRPDLAIHKFTKLINNKKPIHIYGDGNSIRDYTYVDDIVQGIIAALNYNKSNYEIFNLGESQTVQLYYLIRLLEEELGKKAIIETLPNQPGDVPITYADISKSKLLLGYKPTTPVEYGIEYFVRWYKQNCHLSNV